MAEIPHFTGGNYGKLDAETLNAIIEQAYKVRPPEQTQSPHFSQVQPQFPIFARLGGVITEKDKEPPRDEGYQGGDDDDGGGDGEDDWTPQYGGYRWGEVSYDIAARGWSPAEGGRSYTATKRNAAYALGIEYTDEGSAPIYSGETVLLFPANDKKGNPMLVFQPPAASSPWESAVITNVAATTCGVNGATYYEFRRTRFEEKDGSPTMIEVEEQDDAAYGFAINLIEVTGSDLGGSITQSDCNISWTYTPIPAGTHVMVRRLGYSQAAGPDEDLIPVYGFAIPNDTCIQCCDEGFLALRSSTRQIPYPHTGRDIISRMLV